MSTRPRKVTDRQIQRWAERMSDFAWKFEVLFDKIKDSGHPKADQVIAALEDNDVLCRADVVLVVNDALEDEGEMDGADD